MKKTLLFLFAMVISVAALFAQVPQKFSYQAVVRDAGNNLVINQAVGVRVTIIQGGIDGTTVYMETHTVVTNTNGLMTLQIGGGTMLSGDMSAIDWANGPFFIKTEADPNGGTNYTIEGGQQLLSIPYALYAGSSSNGFSGDYNDLINTPDIQYIINHTNVSSFNNDVGYVTSNDIPTYQVLSIHSDTIFLTNGGYVVLPAGFDGDYNSLTNRPSLFSGSYNDLTDQPTISTVPTNVSAFENDANYLTSYTEQQVLSISNDSIYLTGGSFVKLPTGFDGDYNSLTNRPNLFSGSYNDLTDQPTIPTVPTNVSAFENDANYLTSYTETDPQFNAWDKDYNDLTNKPTIPTVPTNVSAFENDANYLTSYTETDPQFNAWNKDYNDLTNKPIIPTVPTNVSAFENDANYLTSYTEQQVLNISNDTIYLTGGSFVKLPEGFDGDYYSLTNRPNLFSGSYNDLTDQPTIPTVPTNVSAFENDANYLTSYTETDPQFNAWDKDYNDLTNKPTIPTVPTNVSAFENDANYLTSYTEQQVLSISNDTIYLTGGSFVKLPAGFDGDYNSLTNRPNLFSGSYNDLADQPTIPTIPTNVSAFTNDAGYLTQATVQEAANIPTQVSAFNNDAGYITANDIPAYQVLSISNDTIYLSNGGYAVLPAGFDGDYNSLTNRPNLFSGSYNDLTDQPTIPTVPTNVSAFENDANYLTSYTEQQVLNISNDTIYLTGGSFVKLPEGFDGDYNNLTNRPNLFSGSYNDLTDQPTIPTVPTNVSAFENDANYLTSYTEQQLLSISNDTIYLTGGSFVKLPAGFDGDYNSLTNRPSLFSGSYNDLTDQPTIPTVPNNVSAFENDANYLTSYTEQQVLSISNDTIYLTGGSFVKLPEGFDGDYNSLTNRPNLFSGSYNDLTDQPTIPTIPTNVSAFTNDAGYLTQATVQEAANIPTQVSAFNNDAGYITANDIPAYQVLSISNDTIYLSNGGYAVLPAGFDGDYNSLTNRPNLFSGSYNDLTDQPTIPTVPTNVSAFENDANYLTSYTEQQVLSISNDTIYLTGGSFVKLPAGFDGNYNNLTNLPNLFSGSYNDLTDQPTIPTVPTNVSVFNNDAGYITMDSIPEIPNVPSDVSVFNNDASYVSNAECTDVNLCTLAATLAQLQAIVEEQQHRIEELEEQIGNNPIDTTNIPTDTTIISNDTIPAGDAHPCPGMPTVTDHEGNVYNTVQIGNQCWMHENLRTTTSPSTGTYLIPATNASYTYTGKQARWYNNDSITYAPQGYGLLYNWNAAVDTFNTSYGETSVSSDSNNALSVSFSGNRRGICPLGWHLPSDVEWTQLTDYVSSQDSYVCGENSSYIAKALASTTGWNISTNTCAVGDNPSNNNTTGFTALPAGASYFGSYIDLGNKAYFWSATQDNGKRAYNRHLYHDSRTSVYRSNDPNYNGFSVRCLRNEKNNTDTIVATLPTVTTGVVSNITATSATCGGEVTADGGAEVTARGVCWSTSHNPTINDNHTTDSSGLGNFTSSITGLTPDTIYYVRAYATNSMGTVYGDEMSFTTLGLPVDAQPCPGVPTVTDYDGNTYYTVQIGNQCWMKENLRTTHYADGTAIEVGTTNSSTIPYRYNPNNDTNTVSTYGYLYNWSAVMHGATSSVEIPSGVQGICPNGWHVPSDAEWRQLTNYVSNQDGYVCVYSNCIAKALSDTMGWEFNSGECYPGDQSVHANNATGFSALPAGSNSGGTSYSFGVYAVFSTASISYGTANSYYYKLNYNTSNVYHGYQPISVANSVRCLRDETNSTDTTVASLPTVTTGVVSNITATSATCGGEVTTDGGAEVTVRGVCWSTNHNPTINDNHTTDSSGLGSFTSSITGLTPDTIYYVRAYATNSMGTVYGDEVNFTTLGLPVDAQPCPGVPTVTDHEGNVYNTVQIGNQCWMRENLRTTTSPSTRTYLIPNADVNYTYTGKQARWYNNDSTTYAPQEYGLLYNWNAAVDTFNTSYGETSVNDDYNKAVLVSFSGNRRGICPLGWHLPNNAEWTQLTNYVSSQDTFVCEGNSNYIAKALASTTGWNFYYSGECNPSDQSVHANNTTDFSALPTGYYTDGYVNFGDAVNFWSATQGNRRYAFYLYFTCNSADVHKTTEYKRDGFSVRCLRN